MLINKYYQEWMDNAPSHKELVEEFLATYDAGVSTLKSYAGILRRYLKYLKDNGIEKPTDKEIIAYKRKMKEEELKQRDGSKKRRGSASVQKTIVVLRVFYKWAGDEHDYYPNFTRGLKGEKVKPEFKRKNLTVDQARAFIDYANEHKNDSIIGLRDCVLAHLLLFTGMRTIEASRADKTDIYKSTVSGRDYLRIQGKARDDKDESVLLSSTLINLINEYLAKRKDKYTPLFIEHGSNHKGGRLTTATISKTIKAMLRAIGINQREVTAHSLRHTFATIAKKSGVPLEELQTRLRHKSGDTTRIYEHYDDRENSTVEYKVEEIITKTNK